jgi:hypothetical protein
MFPLKVDPGWYGDHWYSARPRKQRKVLSSSLGRFAVLGLLLAGSGVVLSHVNDQSDASGYQDWEQE